jgi:hypothetical protein
MPDGLFVRQPEAERERGVPLVGVLFLLMPTRDPRHMAERLAMQVADPDDEPPAGEVMALWVDEADAWDLRRADAGCR